MKPTHATNHYRFDRATKRKLSYTVLAAAFFFLMQL